jgi:hypothetical protein
VDKARRDRALSASEVQQNGKQRDGPCFSQESNSVGKTASLLKNENDEFSETCKTFFCHEKVQKDRPFEGIRLLLLFNKALQKNFSTCYGIYGYYFYPKCGFCRFIPSCLQDKDRL